MFTLMLKKVLRVITPIISAIIGIVLANYLNIFDWMPFVPKEYSYEFCISVYFAMADVIIDFLKEFICDKIQNKFFSIANVLISKPGTEINIDTNAVLNFNEDDLTEALITVYIKGHKKHFKDVELVIKKPAFAEIQEGRSMRQEVYLDSNNYYIKLEELFGHSESVKCKQVFQIALIQNPVDGDSSVTLVPELNKKKRNIRYHHNNAELRAVRR